MKQYLDVLQEIKYGEVITISPKNDLVHNLTDYKLCGIGQITLI
jgi:hypothetical protein